MSFLNRSLWHRVSRVHQNIRRRAVADQEIILRAGRIKYPISQYTHLAHEIPDGFYGISSNILLFWSGNWTWKCFFLITLYKGWARTQTFLLSITFDGRRAIKKSSWVFKKHLFVPLCIKNPCRSQNARSYVVATGLSIKTRFARFFYVGDKNLMSQHWNNLSLL